MFLCWKLSTVMLIPGCHPGCQRHVNRKQPAEWNKDWCSECLLTEPRATIMKRRKHNTSLIFNNNNNNNMKPEENALRICFGCLNWSEGAVEKVRHFRQRPGEWALQKERKKERRTVHTGCGEDAVRLLSPFNGYLNGIYSSQFFIYDSCAFSRRPAHFWSPAQ